MIILYFHIIIASALLSLFLGLYSLFIRKTSLLNRSFFRLSLILFIISSTIYFAFSSNSIERSKMILTTMSFAWFVFPVFFLKFITALTIPDKKRLQTNLNLLFLVPIGLYGSTLLKKELFSGFAKSGTGLVVYHNFKSPLFYITLFFFAVSISASLILLYAWKKENMNTVREKQASLIINSTILVSLILLIYRKITAILYNVIPPPLFPIFLTIWLSAVAFAIFRYHLMVDFPRLVQDKILEHISDMVIILDIDDRISFVNRQTINLSGFQKKELLNKNYNIIIKEKFNRDEEYFENTFLTKSGLEIPVRISVFSYMDNSGFFLGRIITASDLRIMKALQAEINRKETVMLKLKESESKFFRIFNSSPAGLVIFDTRTGRIIDFNSKAKQIIGYSKDEFTDISFLIRKILVNNRENRELVHLLSEGSNVTNRNVLINTKWGIQKTILASFDSIKISGVQYLLLAGSDITESVKMKEQLINTKKLESIGMLAGGIAHDFNNMLTIINGNLSLALSITDDPELRDYLQESLEAGRNASNLTGQLLSFSKGSKPLYKTINLHDVIKKSVKIALSGKNTIPSLYLDASEYTVYADINQLQQVFINLIINSVQAMDNEGEITISTINDSGNKNIIISITDFGKGIPQEKISKIFDPFFSTRKKGTGLGLSIVYSIITNHNGSIDVSSSVLEGTTFTITLPLHNKA